MKTNLKKPQSRMNTYPDPAEVAVPPAPKKKPLKKKGAGAAVKPAWQGVADQMLAKC